MITYGLAKIIALQVMSADILRVCGASLANRIAEQVRLN